MTGLGSTSPGCIVTDFEGCVGENIFVEEVQVEYAGTSRQPLSSDSGYMYCSGNPSENMIALK